MKTKEIENLNKLPDFLENPIDVYIIKICNILSPFLKKSNMTANDLTTFSLLFGFASAYCLLKKIKYIPGIYLFISYFFDCSDGFYARKYNMVSKFGDIYDHVKDFIVILLIIFILYKQNRKKGIILIFIICLLSFSHLGCQEHYYRNNKQHEIHSDTLSHCRYLCPFEHDIENALLVSKYFGTGTSYFIMSLYLFFI